MQNQDKHITSMKEAQELLRAFSKRNEWKDVPNIDKIDHLHEELIELSQHLRYKEEAERIEFVEKNKEIFDKYNHKNAENNLTKK
ncbi:hypothetical protein COB57_03115 [Candidatus Peregrinibacteria bacterium]|nr:MAG: hypothetical protein COB57_03115 [Candidatus Peregrinibacteria bacterium]